MITKEGGRATMTEMMAMIVSSDIDISSKIDREVFEQRKYDEEIEKLQI